MLFIARKNYILFFLLHIFNGFLIHHFFPFISLLLLFDKLFLNFPSLHPACRAKPFMQNPSQENKHNISLPYSQEGINWNYQFLGNRCRKKAGEITIAKLSGKLLAHRQLRKMGYLKHFLLSTQVNYRVVCGTGGTQSLKALLPLKGSVTPGYCGGAPCGMDACYLFSTDTEFYE